MLNKIVRGLLIAVLVALLVGFGACGLFGTVGGLRDVMNPRPSEMQLGGLVLGCGLAGLAVAAVAGFLLRKLLRRPHGGGSAE